MWVGLRKASPALMCDKNSFLGLKKPGSGLLQCMTCE